MHRGESRSEHAHAWAARYRAEPIGEAQQAAEGRSRLWKMRRRADLGLHDHACTVTGDSRGVALEAAPDAVAADPAHVLAQTKSPRPHTRSLDRQRLAATSVTRKRERSPGVGPGLSCRGRNPPVQRRAPALAGRLDDVDRAQAVGGPLRELQTASQEGSQLAGAEWLRRKLRKRAVRRIRVWIGGRRRLLHPPPKNRRTTNDPRRGRAAHRGRLRQHHVPHPWEQHGTARCPA